MVTIAQRIPGNKGGEGNLEAHSRLDRNVGRLEGGANWSLTSHARQCDCVQQCIGNLAVRTTFLGSDVVGVVGHPHRLAH